MINLSSFIAFHARRTPERCALKYRGEEISYAAFDQRIRTVGGWLASRGIGPDDVVAVLMKNSAAFLDIAFAASHIGAVFLPINYRLASDEVAYIVENSGARVLIADEELAANAAGTCAHRPGRRSRASRRHPACAGCHARSRRIAGCPPT